MSRSGRHQRFVHLATIASLLTFLTAIGAWIFTTVGWGRWTALQRPNASYLATLSGGYLTLQTARLRPDPQRPATADWQWLSGPVFPFVAAGTLEDKSVFSRAGLMTTLERIPYSDGVVGKDPNVVAGSINAVCRTLVIPLWLIALIAAVLPFSWARHYQHQRVRQARIRQGRCPGCGYDLRGSADRCPECGEVSTPGDKAMA